MTLEVQRRRRDDAVGVVQRRAARRFLERHLGVLVEEARGLLVLRPRSVRADGSAERLRLGAQAASAFPAAGDERRAPRGAQPRNQRRERNRRILHGGYSTYRFVGFVICYISELDGWDTTDGVVCGAARVERAGEPGRGQAVGGGPVARQAGRAPSVDRSRRVAAAGATGRAAVVRQVERDAVGRSPGGRRSGQPDGGSERSAVAARRADRRRSRRRTRRGARFNSRRNGSCSAS